MAKKQKDTDYLFLSAYLRAKELKLLNSVRINRMLSAEDAVDAARILTECGYSEVNSLTLETVDQLISQRRAESLGELRTLAPVPAMVDCFLLRYDYHNVKVLLKAQAMNVDGQSMLMDCGRVPADRLTEAFLADELSLLPSALAQAIQAAKSVLAETHDPQLADITLDTACLTELLDMAEKTGSAFLLDYARHKIDCTNLRTVVRAVRLGRDSAFLMRAQAPGGYVDPEKLASAALAGTELSGLFSGPLKDAAAEGTNLLTGGSLTDFEKCCDNALMAQLRTASRVGFGDQVLVAHIGALEAEFTAVRVILNGKLAGLSGALISERLRDTYV